MPRLKRIKAVCQNVPVNLDEEYYDEELLIWQCPQCKGIMGVDGTFIEQEVGDIYCPMCQEKQDVRRLEEINDPILEIKR